MGVVLAGCCWFAFGLLLRIGDARVSTPWIPELGLTVTFQCEGIGRLLALMVTGIGGLIMAYAGTYVADDPRGMAFLAKMQLFLLSMLGLVLAGNLVVMLFFWEGTTVTSYLLIAHTRTPPARAAAFKALLVTGSGGVCLLVATVLIANIVGTTDLAQLVILKDVLLASPLAPVVITLVLVAGLTKSAQFPFHFWLPESMSAPTPASALLHSATMVKAGVFLFATLAPVFASQKLWFIPLITLGTITMLLGAWQGIKQWDLKALLAQTTISQLGLMTLLVGVGTPAAMRALAVVLLGHGLYKSTLFLITGSVDHTAHTRDLRKLGGLFRPMPLTAVAAILGALGMAGVLPTAGYLGKELVLSASLDLFLCSWVVISGVISVMLACVIVWDVFFASAKRDPHAAASHPHESPAGLWLPPLTIGLMSLLLPLFGLHWLDNLLTEFAGKASSTPLHLFEGFTPAFLTSLAILAVGALLFLVRTPLRTFASTFDAGSLASRGYDGLLQGAAALARLAIRPQNGVLHHYLIVTLVVGFGLILFLGHPPLTWSLPTFNRNPLTFLKAFTLLLCVGASFASVTLLRDLFAIIALGSSGLAIALLFCLEPAPDVALVMVVVDILTVVILVLSLMKLPAEYRGRVARETSRLSDRRRRTLDLIVCLGAGLVVTVICLETLSKGTTGSVAAGGGVVSDVSRLSRVTPYYEATARALTSAKDIVGAIVVDFRGFDTLIEITVFSLAGLGIYSLLRYAAPYAGNKFGDDSAAGRQTLPRSIKGIAGPVTSPLLRGLAWVLLPLTVMIAATQIMFGHLGPGDGFTAGVTVILGVAFFYAIMGYRTSRRTLRWLRPAHFVGAGLLIAFAIGWLAIPLGHQQMFFSPFDVGHAIGLDSILPAELHFSGAFFFELAIALVVLGSSTLMVDTLARVAERDVEAEASLEQIEALEERGVVTQPEEAPIDPTAGPEAAH